MLPGSVDPRENERLSRADAAVSVGCGLTAFINYYATICPTVGPGDSGELTIAALKLGVAHPPGYPLFTWLGRLACLIPAREPALATNILTAVTAAAAVAMLYAAARSLRLGRLGAVVAALALAFSPALWPQATAHEVYGLGLFFLAAMLFLCAGRTAAEPRRLLLAAFLFGLAVGHQPTAVLWLPALAALARRRDLSALPSGFAFLLFLLGLSTCLGTMVLARTGPAVNWGDPSTLGRLWQHVTAAQYQGLALGVSGPEFWHRLGRLPGWLDQATSRTGLKLSVFGLAWLAFRDRRALLVTLLLVGTALFGLGYRIPDYEVHLLPALLGVALAAGAGAHWFEMQVAHIWPAVERHRARRASRMTAARATRPISPVVRGAVEAIAALLLLAVPGQALFTNARLNAEGRTTIVRDFGANLLASLPRDAVFIYGGDVAGNAIRYLQATRSARADVLVVSADMLFSRVYDDWLRARVPIPPWETMLRDAGSGPHEQRLQSLLAQVIAAARGRPVLLGTELMTPAFFAGPVVRDWQAVPIGIVNRLLPATDSLTPAAVVPGNRELWEGYTLVSATPHFRSPDFQNIQLTYATSRNNFGMLCLAHGWRDEARASLAAALKYPVPDELREIFEQNLARVGAGSD